MTEKELSCITKKIRALDRAERAAALQKAELLVSALEHHFKRTADWVAWAISGCLPVRLPMTMAKLDEAGSANG